MVESGINILKAKNLENKLKWCRVNNWTQAKDALDTFKEKIRRKNNNRMKTFVKSTD